MLQRRMGLHVRQDDLSLVLSNEREGNLMAARQSQAAEMSSRIETVVG